MHNSLTLEYVKKKFELEGYKLLSTKYIDQFYKLRYLCPKGHKHAIIWKSWREGHRCPYCVKLTPRPWRRVNLTKIKESFENEGYILISKTCSNVKLEKLKYICPHGHEYAIKWNNWQQGQRCAICFGNPKITIEQIRKSFEDQKYTLLSDKYLNNSSKLDYICPEKHRHNISWGNWQNGKRCPYCAGLVKKTIEFIRSEFEKEKYTLLTSNYINEKQKLDFICSKGHTYSISWSEWNIGRRCTFCRRENMRKIFKQKWKDPVYQKNVRNGLHLKPNKPETILLNLLNQLFPNEYKYVGDFQFFLGGKNPDFMNCNHQKKLIECYGTYWHRNDNPQKRINHFKQFGFDTLIVWENELKDREMLVERLREFHINN